jgi:hypothetical protein
LTKSIASFSSWASEDSQSNCAAIGRVKLAINLATNERVAIKIMNHKIDEVQIDRVY